MRLPFWKEPARAKKLEVVRREAIKLRLAEWKADEKLVGEAGKVFAMEQFRLMLDVLRNENPANMQLPIGTTIEDRSVHQARAEGYNMAIANLESMIEAAVLPEPLEAEFAPEEIHTTT